MTWWNSINWEQIIIPIIAGVFAIITTLIAFRKYNIILRNKQRYYAKTYIFEKKNEAINKTIEFIYSMATIIVYRMEIDNINFKNPKLKDFKNFAGWTKKFENEYGEIIIPASMKVIAIKNNDEIDKNQFQTLHYTLHSYLRMKIIEQFYKVIEIKGKINLYMSNTAVLAEVTALAEWIFDINQTDEYKNQSSDNFAEKVKEAMTIIIKQMKNELEENINNPDFSLKLHKTAKDAKIRYDDENKKLIIEDHVSDSAKIQLF